MDNMFFSEKRQLELLEKSKSLALYKSKRVSAEQYRSVIKSRLMNEAMVRGVSSVQAQEREAYASPEYEQTIDALEFATRMETELYWELKLFDVEVQVWRTYQANKRNDL